MEKPSTRLVDTRAYVDMLRTVLEEGHEANLTVAGSSMSPFLIHHRDAVRFKTPDRPLRRGDMVFFQRENGQYILHRILRETPEGFDIVGDGQTEIERGVKPEQIFAVVTRVRRKGRWIGPEAFWWRFFETVWLWMLPLRPLISGTYARITRRRRENEES